MHTCSNSYKAVALTSELVAWNTSLVFLSQLRLMFPLDIHTLGMGHPVSNKKKHNEERKTTEVMNLISRE